MFTSIKITFVISSGKLFSSVNVGVMLVPYRFLLLSFFHTLRSFSTDTDEVRVMAKEMRSRISMLSTKLVKQLKRRDKHAYKLQRNFDVLTAILQAVSLKRRKQNLEFSCLSNFNVINASILYRLFLFFPYLTKEKKVSFVVKAIIRNKNMHVVGYNSFPIKKDRSFENCYDCSVFITKSVVLRR